MSSKATSNGQSRAAFAKLEQRVSSLESELAALKAAASAPVKDWRSTIGMFTGDEVMKRIDEAAMAFREADREKARRKFARQKQRAGQAGR